MLRDDAAMPVSPGGRGGEGASSTGNDEEAEIVRLALSVVQEAKAVRHKRAGIQQLVQFTQQLADLMQQLQSLGLSQDDVTLSNLKKLLQEASRTVSPNEQRRNNKRMAQDDNILEVAYRIEYFVQILPFIAMRDV
ncbi:hypothetical protein BAE44_0023538 [Dichanthelium oligosanthes]|uniref:Uncharacterized protein n=1 Tax=Dichanthelium oligosanthes TaxID=888268 RepID=A0A1E5URF5_9POAL|nr:hypothetical protein BAE44_0023538 [Dichanthelium oligosanthes]